MSSGIEKAWDILRGLNPIDVSRDAGVSFKDTGYIIKSLGMDFFIDLSKGDITALTKEAMTIINRYNYFLSHSVLWYLIGAKNVPPTGRLIKPQDLRGGHHFFTGTHELPLTGLASKFKEDREGFLKRAIALGGSPLSYGDASTVLYPMPRIPITIILWTACEEFPERADLLFDSSVQVHISLDIIWSTAMLTVLSMLI